ncbi:rhomboid-like protein [Streptomyces cinnamoneus]|uniref:rhomboid-like protein n=1 Tax=Streptomyces cinnamoneus TaxID=53446 RepID=UPI0033CDDF6C
MTPVDADERAGAGAAASAGRRRRAFRALGRLLPSPKAAPFTFVYGLVLLGTAVYADLGDEATVNQLLRDSSTDAAHLADNPAFVLVASALWVAGGLYSAYGVAFVLVLTALERRVGGARTAGVFLLGHVLATLATELPVAGAVAAGQLPEASLHRLDYGISFGLMACVGALSGLLRPPGRWALLGVAGAMCTQDLIELVDPLSSWGHPIALLTGLACLPLVREGARRAGRAGTAAAAGTASADGAVPLPLFPPWLPRQYAPPRAPQEGGPGGPAGRARRRVGEEPFEGRRAEPVRRAPVESEAARDVVGVHDGLDHAHGGEAGGIGVPPRVPGPVGGRGGADGGGEQGRRDADALQSR